MMGGVANENGVKHHAPNAPLKDANERNFLQPRENRNKNVLLNVGLHLL